MGRGENRLKIKRRRIAFSLNAALAETVAVAGDFNGWNTRTHPLKSDGNGNWQRVMMLPLGTYEYKFLVDGRWQTDPNNAESRPNCYGTRNSIIEVVAAKR